MHDPGAVSGHTNIPAGENFRRLEGESGKWWVAKSRAANQISLTELCTFQQNNGYGHSLGQSRQTAAGFWPRMWEARPRKVPRSPGPVAGMSGCAQSKRGQVRRGVWGVGWKGGDKFRSYILNATCLEWPDWANKNKRHSVKFEFQFHSNLIVFLKYIPYTVWGLLRQKKAFAAYLKFQLSAASCILNCNSTSHFQRLAPGSPLKALGPRYDNGSSWAVTTLSSCYILTQVHRIAKFYFF